MQKEYGFALPHKVALFLGGIFFIVMAILGGISFYKNQDFERLLIFAIPGLLFGIYTLFSSYKRKIIVSDTYIGKSNFKQIILPYEDVERIRVVENEMRVMGEGKTIHISKDIENYDSLIKLLVKRLAPVADMEIQGDRKFVEQILSEQ